MASTKSESSATSEHVQQARSAWQLLDMVSSGDVIARQDGSTPAPTFLLLREIARVVIGEDATEEQQDDLAKVTMQRVREIKRVVAAEAPAWCTTAKKPAQAPEALHEARQFAAELTRALTDQLQRIGKTGAKHAAGIRAREAELTPKGGPDPWRLWRLQDKSARFLKLLADALWTDEVQPMLERAARRPPAVVRAVYADRLVRAMTRQTMLPEMDDGVVRDARGVVLGHIALTTETTIEVVRRGAHALGTVAGNRLIKALIHRSHEAWNKGVQDPRRVAFEGGWQGLLNNLRVSQKDHAMVKAIAQAGQCIVWETAHAEHGGLWTWTERRGTKKAPGEIAFVLGDALTPGYADVMSRGSKHLADRIARRLVPELRFEPPMGGARERDHGPIWTLHRLMLLELVDHAEELAATGGVVISRPRWLELAREAGVGESIVDRTLDAWVAGETDLAPPLLSRVDASAWTLADKHGPEREFIRAGGAKRTERDEITDRGRARRATMHPRSHSLQSPDSVVIVESLAQCRTRVDRPPENASKIELMCDRVG